MKRQEQVLFYQFRDMEKLQLARKVLSRMGIVSKVIPVDDWTQKVGYLLGMKGFKAAEKPDADDDFVFPHEVMVLHNIRNKRLDEVLLALRRGGVSKVQYKSVVTPFNTLWTLRRLCETMQKEHAVMVQQQEKEKQKTEQEQET